jgi:hypothetical protein
MKRTAIAFAAALLTLIAMPATAIDNLAWRCGETLVIVSISQNTINIAVSGPKKASDVVTITSAPLGVFSNGSPCTAVRDE